jgi:hypothetical protein
MDERRVREQSAQSTQSTQSTQSAQSAQSAQSEQDVHAREAYRVAEVKAALKLFKLVGRSAQAVPPSVPAPVPTQLQQSDAASKLLSGVIYAGITHRPRTLAGLIGSAFVHYLNTVVQEHQGRPILEFGKPIYEPQASQIPRSDKPNSVKKRRAKSRGAP